MNLLVPSTCHVWQNQQAWTSFCSRLSNADSKYSMRLGQLMQWKDADKVDLNIPQRVQRKVQGLCSSVFQWFYLGFREYQSKQTQSFVFSDFQIVHNCISPLWLVSHNFIHFRSWNKLKRDWKGKGIKRG